MIHAQLMHSFTFFFITHQSQQNSHQLTMPPLPFFLPAAAALILLFVSSSSTTVEECGSNLLALAPCGPFVQGIAAKPVQTCCVNLNQLYIQRPACLCLLLNHTSSLPINSTLALRLPLLCNLHILPSTCPGISLPAFSPPASISFGSNPKSGDAGGISSYPIITAPRPKFMGFGFHNNADERLKAKLPLLMLISAATFAFYH